MIGVGSRPDDASAGRPSPAPDRSRRRGGGWRLLDLAALDPDRERPYWTALSLVPGLGPAGFARLLERYGSAEAAWADGPRLLESVHGLPDEARAELARLRRTGADRVAAGVELAMRAAGGRLITAIDGAYPGRLADLDPRPPVLYLLGDPDSLAAPCVALVGTRRASGYGRSVAAELADELARVGVTVVSGLALGIDGAAHAASLRAGGRSAAVLPSPVDRVYPPRHAELARRLVAAGGALVSEVPPGHAIGRPDFARRNRWIAGLSQAVVVVEAPDRSGALLTAAAAISLGRDLYAVPGPIDAAASRGCNRLIADHHAVLLTSPAALLHGVRAPRQTDPVSVSSLSEAEGMLLYRLLRRSGSIEELIDRTGLGAGAVAAGLTLLEARGLVESFGGATFHPTLAARRIERGA